MVEIKYIPAIGGAFNNKPKTPYSECIYWWKKECTFYYPYILSSAFYNFDRHNYREELDIAPNVTIIADSGGYQSVSMSKDIDVIKILRWQEKVANIGLTLDTPPYTMSETMQFGSKLTGEGFIKKMEQTAVNSEKAIESRKNNNLKLYATIQGETYQEMKSWYDRLTKNHQFDGYALAPKPSTSPEQIAKYLIFAKENFPDKPIHILQVSGKTSIPMIAYYGLLSKHPLITFDSSSYIIGSKYKAIFNPLKYFDMIKLSSDRERILTENNIVADFKQSPCICESCKMINKYNILSEEGKDDTFGLSLLSLHNLNHIVDYTSIITGIKDKEYLKFFISKHSRNALKGIEYIDGCIENGLENYEKGVRHRTKNLLDYY